VDSRPERRRIRSDCWQRSNSSKSPALGRPAAGRIEGSRHQNMKELRSFGGHLRALFAFDPKRRAIVLLDGDKRDDWSDWYERDIPIAENLYDEHLRNPDDEPG
jgi:hypothetical protein